MPVDLLRFNRALRILELNKQPPPTGDEEQVVRPARIAARYQLDRDAWYAELAESSAYHGVFDLGFFPTHLVLGHATNDHE